MTGSKGPRVHPVCSRCAERHHHFAYCKDGVRRIKNAPPFQKGDPLRGAAKAAHDRRLAETGDATTETVTEAPATTVTAPEQPATVTAATARGDMRTLAESLPEGSQQRRSIELLLARDEAREAHHKAEQEIQTRDPSARLPVPTILRDPSEEAGRALNSEMDRLIFAAGTSRASQREVMPKEAKLVHDTLAGLEERREEERHAAEEASRLPAHRPGEQPWACNDCGQRFHSGTLEEVRQWARNDPSWKFRCPKCQSPKVQLIERVA